MAVLAAAYVRTSSATNVGEDKDSKPRQVTAIQQYANANGISVSEEAIFADEGVSGTVALMFRPAWRKLIDYCEKHCIDTILFEDSSRFARDLVIQESGYKEMTGQGYNLVSTTTPGQFLHDSPEATLVRQLLGAVAQFQRDATSERLKCARMRSAESKGKRDLLGNLKPAGRNSRLDGEDSIVIRAILAPWAAKQKLAHGDVTVISNELHDAGITGANGISVTKKTVQGWVASMKLNLKE